MRDVIPDSSEIEGEPGTHAIRARHLMKGSYMYVVPTRTSLLQIHVIKLSLDTSVLCTVS